VAITITLSDELVVGLEPKAREQKRTVEQLALSILAGAAEESVPTPEEVVARVQSTPPNPSHIRPATSNLTTICCATLRSIPASIWRIGSVNGNRRKPDEDAYASQ